MSLEILLELGFVHSAACNLVNNETLQIEIFANQNERNLLYAFVSEEQVKYIGITENTFQNRLYGYGRPGSRQTTNIRVNERARHLLRDDQQVNIYCFANRNMLQYRGININLAAGLEINLINKIAQYNNDNNYEPLWNI